MKCPWIVENTDGVQYKATMQSPTYINCNMQYIHQCVFHSRAINVQFLANVNGCCVPSTPADGRSSGWLHCSYWSFIVTYPHSNTWIPWTCLKCRRDGTVAVAKRWQWEPMIIIRLISTSLSAATCWQKESASTIPMPSLTPRLDSTWVYWLKKAIF